MALFTKRDLTKSNVDVANEIFREVLGQRSIYASGLGKFIMPTPSSKECSSQVIHLTQQVDTYKSELEIMLERYDQIQNDLKNLMDRCHSYDQVMAQYMTRAPTQGERQGDNH